MSWKIARWIAIGIAGTLVVLALVASAGSRTATLRAMVVETLADRLDSEVELSAFSVDTFPTVTIQGEGLVIRHAGRKDVPPLIKVEAFRIEGGIVGLLSRPRKFRIVMVSGLQINIPPGGVKVERAAPTTGNAADNPDLAAPSSAKAPEGKPSIAKAPEGTPNAEAPAPSAQRPAPGESPLIVERLVANDAELRIIPRKQGKDPKVFAIHRLEMLSLGIAEKMPFKAQLTNPIPRGMIQTEGEFGPWQKYEPGTTPLNGRYTFTGADLSTIKGIGGRLDSWGEFGGRLEKIAVMGETKSPDFRVNISGQPVPLDTRFQAVVDGTDGDTYLNDVYATFLKTSLHAKGAVTGTRGVKGRTVKLNVNIEKGRIEDLMRLSVKSKEPPMVGDVALHADFTLPPGEADVVEKLVLAGKFDVDGRFTDRDVQKKLTGMSERAAGDDGDEVGSTVMSDLSGRFKLQNGTMAFSDLRFGIPNATVKLQGTYGLKSEQLAFDGTLEMNATISEAAGGGMKSIFLKLVDPLFRKGKAGAVIPIKVRGSRSDPKFGLDVGKVLTRK
jgi:hypothetical protein